MGHSMFVLLTTTKSIVEFIDVLYPSGTMFNGVLLITYTLTAAPPLAFASTVTRVLFAGVDSMYVRLS